MKYVKRPKIVTVPLDEWDPSGLTTVTLREPRFAETARRQQYWSRTEVEHAGIFAREIHDKTIADLATLEMWLTFVDSNIEIESNKEGEESYCPFYKDMPFDEFVETLLLLEDELVIEWHSKVLDLKPEWELT